MGIMKGVILNLNPDVRLVDLSHEVGPQEILAGAFMLQSAWDYFPPGTIHLAVVDPGVGSRRRAMAAACGGQFLVGPDNGLFSLIFAEYTPHTLIKFKESPLFSAKDFGHLSRPGHIRPGSGPSVSGSALNRYGPGTL